jgi:hypothetical protein
VSHNILDNKNAAALYLEDMFSFWNSGGLSNSWLEINNNKLRGGEPGSQTGGGITIGDAAGAKVQYAKYCRIKDNILIRTQAFGVGVAGGQYSEIMGNKIYIPKDHTTRLRKHPYHNEVTPNAGDGMVIFDYSAGLHGASFPCSNHVVTGNEAFAVKPDGTAEPKWFHGACNPITDTGNVWHWNANDPGKLGEHLLPNNMFLGLNNNYFSGRRS